MKRNKKKQNMNQMFNERLKVNESKFKFSINTIKYIFNGKNDLSIYKQKINIIELILCIFFFIFKYKIKSLFTFFINLHEDHQSNYMKRKVMMKRKFMQIADLNN